MERGYVKQSLIGLIVALTFTAGGMSAGWVAPIMVRLLSNDSEIPMTDNEGSWVAAGTEIGDMFTPIPAGILADRFGRKPVIFVSAPMYAVGWCILLLTRSYFWLMASRLVFGMAIGISFTVCTVYIGEIAEPKIRGMLSTLNIIMWYVGILFSYCVGPYISYDMFSYISLTLPAVLMIGLLFITETPYNLLLRNKNTKARNELEKLRNCNNESIDDEIRSIRAAILEGSEKEKSLMDLITDPVCRMSLFIFSIIICTSLFGGITVLYSYATDIFSAAGSSLLTPDQCTIVLGIIYLSLTIITAGTVDKFGRRPLFLISALGCGICHFISGLYFFLQKETSINISNYSWILILAVCGYCIFVSMGIGPLMPVYQGEIFPNEIKGVASGVFVVMMCFLSVIALKMFQIINTNLNIYVSFWLFAFINMLGFILMYKYLIETNGKTLIEIQSELKALLQNSSKKSTINTNSETVPITNKV